MIWPRSKIISILTAASWLVTCRRSGRQRKRVAVKRGDLIVPYRRRAQTARSVTTLPVAAKTNRHKAIFEPISIVPSISMA